MLNGNSKKEAEYIGNLAFFLDGPNMLRADVGIDINDFPPLLSKYGSIVLKNAYLSRHATEGTIDMCHYRGFKVIIPFDDVDTSLVADAIETIITRDDIKGIVIASRDVDMLPIVHKCRDKAKKSIVVVPTITDQSVSQVLVASADFVEYVERRRLITPVSQQPPA